MIDNDYHATDKKLLFCKGCNHVWQPWFEALEKMIVYTDFPSIGKERKTCLMCKNAEHKIISGD